MKIPEKETKKTTPVQWKHEEKRPQGSGDRTSSQRKEETVIILTQMQANSICCMASKSIHLNVNSLKKKTTKIGLDAMSHPYKWPCFPYRRYIL